MAAVIATTAIGFFVIVIRSADEPESPPTATATATATPTQAAEQTPAPTAVLEGIALTRPIEVRSGPSSDYAIVTRLAVTDSINVLGRSMDGQWLVVAAEDRPTLTGWIPIDAVSGVDHGPLPVVAPPGATPAPGGATLTPDLPDLVISRVYAQRNTLWVEVTNEGVVDAIGEFRVSIDGGPEIALDVKPGEPLRPDESLSALIPGITLQLRHRVEVRLFPAENLQEETTENNVWIGTVSPDIPNDIGISNAEIDEEAGHLVVTLLNNSPIVIKGTFTVSVRETPPNNALLGREFLTDEFGPGNTLEVHFEEITEIDLTQVTIILSTDAIEDAVIANNTYPR